MKPPAISKRHPLTRIGRRGAVGAMALRKRQRLKEAALLVSLTVMIAIFYVWSRLAVVQTGYRLHHLANEYHQLEDQYRELKLEIASRTSPARLAPLAESKFGLRPPQPGQVVILPEAVRVMQRRVLSTRSPFRRRGINPPTPKGLLAPPAANSPALSAKGRGERGEAPSWQGVRVKNPATPCTPVLVRSHDMKSMLAHGRVRRPNSLRSEHTQRGCGGVVGRSPPPRGCQRREHPMMLAERFPRIMTQRK